jgi:hypothetical protein
MDDVDEPGQDDVDLPRFGGAAHVDRFGDTRRRGRPRSAGGRRSFLSWRHGRLLRFQGSDAGRRSRQGRGGWAAVDTDEGRAGRSRSLPATARVGVAAHEGVPLGAAPGHRGPDRQVCCSPAVATAPGRAPCKPGKTRLSSSRRASDCMVMIFLSGGSPPAQDVVARAPAWAVPVQRYESADRAWGRGQRAALWRPPVGLVPAGDGTASADTATRWWRHRAACSGRRLFGVRAHDGLAGWREPGPSGHAENSHLRNRISRVPTRLLSDERDRLLVSPTDTGPLGGPALLHPERARPRTTRSIARE